MAPVALPVLTKSEPAEVGRLLGVAEVFLKKNLQSELSIVRFAGADAGRAIGDTDG